MINQNELHTVAKMVRESIANAPAFEGMELEVDENGILSTTIGDKIWWRVPVIPCPWPRRMSALYEALTEIEDDLQEERGLDILLFAGDPVMTAA